MTAAPTPAALRLAYRRLYRASLAAVQYACPARYTVRDKLRHAFRHTAASHFDPTRIDRTVEFLDNAARCRGMEHRVVRNLTVVDYWRMSARKKRTYVKNERALDDAAYNAYWENLGLLNESLHLDLR